MAKLVFIGLSITSSWGNGHATTYRALLKALAFRGHDVTFLEQDQPWYSVHRDLPQPQFCRAALYRDEAELFERYAPLVSEADAVIIGSFVPHGAEVCLWAARLVGGPLVFYDIDTPVTLSMLTEGSCSYLDTRTLAKYDLYLSFTGGPFLTRLQELGAKNVAPLYCSVDPEVHRPIGVQKRWMLGYLGTYSADRQEALEKLLLQPARIAQTREFVVAGAQYAKSDSWPTNVSHIHHIAPQKHAEFYCSQFVTLNLTREAMREAGFSPSVRLFEAAACGVPVISDSWPGLERFFVPNREILCASTSEDVLDILESSAERLDTIGQLARSRVLAAHTAKHRALEFEMLLRRVSDGQVTAASARKVERRGGDAIGR